MNRSKKEPKPAPIVERGRDHKLTVNEIMEAAETGYRTIGWDEVLKLVTEIRDLRAHLSAVTRGVPLNGSAGAETNRSG